MLWRTTLETPLGEMTLVASEKGLCLCEFSRPERVSASLAPIREKYGAVRDEADHDHLQVAIKELNAYFSGALTTFHVPLDLVGTDFQVKVWSLLLAIPWGETRTYGDLARELGDISLSRAVGSANGDNRMAIIVPCHRVIGADGTLTGYAGGMDKKRWLLDHENGQQSLF